MFVQTRILDPLLPFPTEPPSKEEYWQVPLAQIEKAWIIASPSPNMHGK